jgi:Na+/phosphate symporter
MVNSFIKHLDKRLNEEIFQTCLREEKIGEILSEHESIEKNRKDIETKLDIVKKAIKTMVDIQYFYLIILKQRVYIFLFSVYCNFNYNSSLII